MHILALRNYEYYIAKCSVFSHIAKMWAGRGVLERSLSRWALNAATWILTKAKLKRFGEEEALWPQRQRLEWHAAKKFAELLEGEGARSVLPESLWKECNASETSSRVSGRQDFRWVCGSLSVWCWGLSVGPCTRKTCSPAEPCTLSSVYVVIALHFIIYFTSLPKFPLLSSPSPLLPSTLSHFRCFKVIHFQVICNIPRTLIQ